MAGLLGNAGAGTAGGTGSIAVTQGQGAQEGPGGCAALDGAAHHQRKEALLHAAGAVCTITSVSMTV